MKTQELQTDLALHLSIEFNQEPGVFLQKSTVIIQKYKNHYCFIMLGPGLVVWCFLWLFTTAETPKKHRKITTREREYIEHCLADKGLKEGVCTNCKQNA